VVLLDVESNVLLLDVSLLDMLELEIELDGMSLLQSDAALIDMSLLCLTTLLRTDVDTLLSMLTVVQHVGLKLEENGCLCLTLNKRIDETLSPSCNSHTIVVL